MASQSGSHHAASDVDSGREIKYLPPGIDVARRMRVRKAAEQRARANSVNSVMSD